MSDESRTFRLLERYRGEYKLPAEWGNLKVTMRPIRIGYGSKRGRPDEILEIEIKFPLLTEMISLKVPVLIEDESKAGVPGAMVDLKEYSKRTLKGEQDSHLKLPFIIVGTGRSKSTSSKDIKCEFDIHEIPNYSLQ